MYNTSDFKTNLQAEQLSTSDIQIEQLMIHLILIMKRHQSNAQSWHLNEEALVISRGIIEEINHRLGYDLNDDTSQLFFFFIGYHFNKFELTFENYLLIVIFNINFKNGSKDAYSI